MAILTRTCFCLPLKWGAIITFVYATVIGLLPLISLPKYIFKISLQIFLMNLVQMSIAVIAGSLGVVGTVLQRPHFLLPFIFVYIGYAVIDFATVVFTIVIGLPFYAHNILKGGGMVTKHVSKSETQDFALYHVFIFAMRVYFTLIVFSWYDQMSNSVKKEASSDYSNEMGAFSSSSTNGSSSMELEI